MDILERQNDNLKEDWLLERQQLLSHEKNIKGKFIGMSWSPLH